ncbi:NAD-dependent protein deacetylase sirtuin-3 [Amia ocellicauda]|uniref:NAD-dependent protein deacetylase sirtuin-3 n=1 Tax=Amia ocellicauda TaxID=2972642 RepID=UPI00346450B3
MMLARERPGAGRTIPKQISGKGAGSQQSHSRATGQCSSQARQAEKIPRKEATALKTCADERGSSRSNRVPGHRKESSTALAQNLSRLAVSDQRSIASRRSRAVKASGITPPRASPTAPPSRAPSKIAHLQDVARLMLHRPCKNIIVVAGAGISTASGIPDFRTPGTGLYANMKKYNIPYPEAIFDIDFFTCDPQPFYSLAKDLYPGSYQPNYIHYFVRMLHEKGMLLRMYTQNIDGLERMCGIPEDKLVEAHGTFSSASCHLCYAKFPAKEAKKSILSNKIPKCKICQGTVKPDVVFFGEDLPQKFCLYSKDFPKADLLIVMGTSLQIEPFSSIIDTVRPSVPRLLLNRAPVGPFQKVPPKSTDVMELGDLVESVKKLARILGWDGEIADLIKHQEPGLSPNDHSSVGSKESVKVPPPPVARAKVNQKSNGENTNGRRVLRSSSVPACRDGGQGRRDSSSNDSSSSSGSDTEHNLFHPQ